jgi:hypothetical protein
MPTRRVPPHTAGLAFPIMVIPAAAGAAPRRTRRARHGLGEEENPVLGGPGDRT